MFLVLSSMGLVWRRRRADSKANAAGLSATPTATAGASGKNSISSVDGASTKKNTEEISVDKKFIAPVKFGSFGRRNRTPSMTKTETCTTSTSTSSVAVAVAARGGGVDDATHVSVLCFVCCQVLFEETHVAATVVSQR